MSPAAAQLDDFTRQASVPSTQTEGLAVIFAVITLPVVLYVAHLAPHGRILYPLANVMLAGVLFARGSPWYAGHCLLLFCCVSLVRRLVDEQAGWDPSNPILLTPYLCCLFAGAGLLSHWYTRPPRYLGAFLLLLSCVVYGTVNAIVHGRAYAACIDALKWSVGPLFSVYLLSHSAQHELRAVIEGCLVWAAAIMGLYGVFQFVNPPSWDMEWMRSAAQLGMTSLGEPAPFSLRVFSTMNSPGSFGALMSAGIIVALKRRASVTALTVPLMIAGLALCQYRTVWAATALALVLVLASRPLAVKPTNILAVIAVGLALSATIAVPRIREAVVQRASSLMELKSDRSLEGRLSQYSALTRDDQDLVLGAGLAISGAARTLDKQNRVVIDSGLIEIWRSMGIVVGTMFLLGIAAAVAPLFGVRSSPFQANWVHLNSDRAIALATFVQLPMGSVHIGEIGFSGWLFLALGLASLAAESAGEPRVTTHGVYP